MASMLGMGRCVCSVEDTKCVSVVSNEHPGHTESSHKKCKRVNPKKEVPIAAIVYIYNHFMNCVDQSD